MRTNTNLAAEIIYKEETLREREREDSVSFKNKNLNLHKAKKNKNDEFYTQLADIEKEVIKYKDHFKDKVIYCNCDDPVWSNFVRYFIMQFNFFGLKRLIATGYSVGDGSLTNQINFKDLFLPKRTYYFDIEKVSQELVNLVTKSAENSLSNDKLFEILKENNLIKELKEDGDFRSEECIDLLKQSDIVVTNPPFSLFREYVEQLFNYNKKFLIIGNKNAITYKEVFKHIKDNELWLGYGNVKMFINNKFEKQKFGNVGWFTNLEISKRDEPLILYKKYYNSEEDKNNPNYTNPAYPKYDNYDAIEVSKVVDIPVDYYGVMGVPITFLDKYTPKQFDIVKFRKGDDEKDLVYRKQEYLKEDIEREREFENFTNEYLFAVIGIANSARWIGDYECYTKINGRKIYNRILIKRV